MKIIISPWETVMGSSGPTIGVHKGGRAALPRSPKGKAARQHRPTAFTRAELLVILAVLALLALVVLPALANNRPRSARVICANNLRQIGMAMQLWGNDHNDLTPWDVPVAEGGTKLHPLAVNVWLHFAWMSNELVSPKVLFCPSDTGRPASDFRLAPGTGYLNANLRGNATSYLLSHAFRGGPNVLLVADRNMGSDQGLGGCSVFNTALGVSFRPYSGAFVWNTNLHNHQGNFLRADGRVEQVSNEGMRDVIARYPIDDNGNIHFIPPR
jgi:prepilin-type processing-associated H-X9-DG protein